MKKSFIFLTLAILFISVVYVVFGMETKRAVPITTKLPTQSLAPSPTPTLLPLRKVLPNDYHIFQSFNNCGPASLSMALSYFGIHKTQEELGQALRPYQNAIGDNDDKSVTFDELAKEAQKYDLLSYHRPNGDIALLKQFIANDIPVLTRTWLHVDEDIGHYRIVKGYDDTTQTIIQDDSYENKNLSFSYNDFNTMWEKFDYEYLVLVPQAKKQLAEKILGKNLDEQYAWNQAIEQNNTLLQQNPNDMYTRFNLSIAYYHTKNYEKSIEEFEQVEQRLPFRTLWYQIEPILAYYEAGKDTTVLSLTERILNNQNRAFSELYIIRGNIYKKQGNVAAAQHEYEQAVFYNSNLEEAKEALKNL